VCFLLPNDLPISDCPKMVISYTSICPNIHGGQPYFLRAHLSIYIFVCFYLRLTSFRLDTVSIISLYKSNLASPYCLISRDVCKETDGTRSPLFWLGVMLPRMPNKSRRVSKPRFSNMMGCQSWVSRCRSSGGGC